MKEVICQHCGKPFPVGLPEIINVSADAELKASVLSGSIFLEECPHCGTRQVLGGPLVYMDPEEHLLVFLTDKPLSLEDTQGYTARLVSKTGDLIEKVKIFDAGLDDVAVEMCKYVMRQEMGRDADFKFLKMDGADNDLVFTYPEKGRMEMMAVGFNVYEDCRGIISRNPVMASRAAGLVKVDADWISSFFA